MEKNLRCEQEERALEFLAAMGVSKLFSDVVKNGDEKLARFFADFCDFPELEGYIRKFEEKTGALVYYVTRENLGFGECFSLLYVSKYEEDWVIQTPRAVGEKQYIAFAWCWNVTRDDCSEFGSIVVENNRGMLFRIG